MSVVIVGGNERMVCQYEDVCKSYGCKAKVFVKENGGFEKEAGDPQDLLIVFVSTVSHKMVISASQEAKTESGSLLPGVQSSSISALEELLSRHCKGR